MHTETERSLFLSIRAWSSKIKLYCQVLKNYVHNAATSSYSDSPLTLHIVFPATAKLAISLIKDRR